MCDYSLHAVETRPATVGDKLVSTSFTNCFTRGFAAVGDTSVAVCLRPGTEIAFDQDVEIDHGFGRLLPSLGFGRITERVARFRKINEEHLDAHHDALEFPSGRIVLVTRLCEGQVATVLQLPADAHAAQEHRRAEAPAREGAPIG
ncbi:MAG TPA: hypothetical protein VFB31_01620 [Pseudolabrys sp.]|nr:hypothetical protein [Pseudolabrys sp.]